MLRFLVACASNVGRVKVTVCFECEIPAIDNGPSSILSTRPYCRSQSVACSSCSGNIARRGSQFEFGERA